MSGKGARPHVGVGWRDRTGSAWLGIWPVLLKVAGWLLVVLGVVQVLDGVLVGLAVPVMAAGAILPGLLSLVVGINTLLLVRLLQARKSGRR